MIFDNNEVRIIPVRPLMRLFGAFQHVGPPVSFETRDRAVLDGATDLDVYPYLPKANVGKTCAASYLCLMSGCVR